MLVSAVNSFGGTQRGVPIESTPDTTGPDPRSVINGPPESPWQVVEPDPLKFQHTWLASTTGSPVIEAGQAPVVTLPTRFTPLPGFAAPPVPPKPTMVPCVPYGGLPTV